MLVGRVNTKERLIRLGIIDHKDMICVLCKKETENDFHLFIAVSSRDRCGVLGYMPIINFGLFQEPL